MNTDTIKEQLFRSFRDKKYRHLFACRHFFTNIAAQIFAIRESLNGMTQQQLAEKAKMAQPRIALLEDPEHENVSIKTLQRIAEAFDMAFIGRFVSFGELADWIAHSTASLVPAEFKRDPYHLAFLYTRGNYIAEEQQEKATTLLVTASITAGVESRGQVKELEGTIKQNPVWTLLSQPVSQPVYKKQGSGVFV